MYNLLNPLRWKHWVLDQPLGLRMLVCMGGALLAMVVVGAMSVQAVRMQSAVVAELALASRAQHFQQDADMYHDGLRAYVYAAALATEYPAIDEQLVLAGLKADSAKFRSDFEQLSRLANTDALRESVAQSRVVAEAYISTANEIAQQTLVNRDAALLRLDDLDREFETLKVVMDKQTQMIGGMIAAANTHAQESDVKTRQQIGFAMLGSGLLVLWLSWALVSSVRQTIDNMRKVAVAMANGELGQRNSLRSHDELGQLGGAIDRMADKLRDTIQRLRADAERDAFGTQLVEALEMADTEPEAHNAIARAMSVVALDRPMELLLADSSRAQLERATQHAEAGAPGCGVESPFSCVAVRRGNPVTFEDSESLNACPRLRGRPAGAVSAVCVPVSFMGRSLGVLHTTGPVRQLPSAEQISQLTTLGIQAGSRIGTVRAFERTQMQAATDSLTGLANRRSLEEVVTTLSAGGSAYSLVMCDLDHFKRLNDTFGHEAGDAALKTFSDVLRETIRTEDHGARWGGEEFAIVMPGASARDALKVVDRMRAALAERIVISGTAPFTASFGISDTSMSKAFRELVRIADDALYQSKENGRDRAMIGDPLYVHSTAPRRKSDHHGAIDAAKMSAAV